MLFGDCGVEAALFAETAIKYSLVAANAYVFVLLIVLARRRIRRDATKRDAARDGDALVVTAHPDDECLFFAPSILRLASDGRNVHVLCLSTGDYEGLGSIRRQELFKSCKCLGIDESRVEIINDDALPDNPKVEWSTTRIATHIAAYIDRQKSRLDATTDAQSTGGIAVILSFDDSGVSGHPNHISVHRAIAEMARCRRLEGIRTLALETTNVVRKYISVVDVAFSHLLCETTASSSYSQYTRAVRAMRAHASQFVWYRRLYVLFSRYMWVNTLREMPSGKSEKS
eukprot:Opistho-2@37306